MDRAWIDGKEVNLKAAIAEAASLLAASRFPLIAGLGTDLAGARAAIALAKRVGAVVDHMHADALLRSVDVMSSAHLMTTTQAELRTRADCLLLVGSGIGNEFSELRGPRRSGTPKQSVTWVCPDRDGRERAKGTQVNLIGRNPADLPVVLAMLRARIAGHGIGKGPAADKLIDDAVAQLKAAHFGVAVWSVQNVDALALEMLQGIVADLNATTRFTSLPIDPPDNAPGVLQACGWMTGYPMRTSFARSGAHHDPWAFDATRLVSAGEVDFAFWISSYQSDAPDWIGAVPTVALTRADMRPQSAVRVAIEVAQPGVDHDSVEFVPAPGALAFVSASHPSHTPSVARVVSEIATLLPGAGG